jgi:hypothetical protein
MARFERESASSVFDHIFSLFVLAVLDWPAVSSHFDSCPGINLPGEGTYPGINCDAPVMMHLSSWFTIMYILRALPRLRGQLHALYYISKRTRQLANKGNITVSPFIHIDKSH